MRFFHLEIREERTTADTHLITTSDVSTKCNLMIDDVVVAFINTTTVWAVFKGLCDVLNVNHIRNYTHRPTLLSLLGGFQVDLLR